MTHWKQFLKAMCLTAAAATLIAAQTAGSQENRGLGLKPSKPTASKKSASNDASTDRPELILQTGHAQKVDSMAFSPDGRLLVSGGADSAIKIWDLQLGRELRTLNRHTGGVRAVRFSPDGKTIASGGVDGKLKIWDLASGQELKDIQAHASAVNSLAFSQDGRYLATGGADTAIKIWEVASWKELWALSGHSGWVTALAFDPVVAETLASGGADGEVRLWDVKSGKLLKALVGHKKGVRALAYSPDGQTLASGGLDASVRLWQSPRGKRLETIEGKSGPLLAVAFSSDGSQLITAAADRTTKQYSVGSWRETNASGAPEMLDHFEAIAISPDGAYRAASSGARTIELTRISDGGGGRTLASYTNSVLATAFSQNGRWFASGHKDTSIQLWDIKVGREIRTLSSNAGSVNALAFSPSSEIIAAGSLGGAVKVWEVVSGREIPTPLKHNASVNALLFSPDGKWLISASGDRAIKLWQAGTAEQPHVLEGHASDVNALSVSSNGHWLASGSADGSVKIWDLNNLRLLRSFSAGAGAVNALAFNPEQSLLATAGADRKVKFWKTADWSLDREFDGEQGEIFAMAFSEDGKSLASGGAGSAVKLWSRSENREKLSFDGHVGAVHSLAFLPGKAMLASGSDDGGTRIWDAEKGTLLASVVSLRASNDWLVAAPNGLFDGSPAAWPQILWRFSNNTTSVAPVEIFFNEFFHPDLLGEILSGKEIKPAQDISERDRRQPQINIQTANPQADAASSPLVARTIHIKLEVAESPVDSTHTAGSGVRDVRLFRNGSLVKVWRGDVIAQGAGSRTLEVEIPLVAGENRLTAYAFNHDNIKSADAFLNLTGAGTLKRKGTMYLLAVGINRYANPDYKLEYATADARIFGDELARRQTMLGIYERIEVIPLLDQDAVKSNILAALGRLTRKQTGLPAGAPPILERLKPAEPEDLVVIYFAGHGAADDERFYFIPHDLGYAGRRADLDEAGMQAVFAHSVSDEEMGQRLEEIDAGQVVLVIDACQSGQALEAEEKRRGPMNSKGLAQLTYEKGMNILTAAQSYQAALETSRLKHGYLTYALIEDGLRKMEADNRPHDNQVLLREWLDYAAERVPRMQEESSVAARGLGLKPSTKPQAEKSLNAAEIQRPRVFYRREMDAQPLVIARPEPPPGTTP